MDGSRVVGGNGETMVFGDCDDFAIECAVEPDLSPPSSVWGRMCIWCRGVPVGDITSEHCALYPPYSDFVWLASHLGEGLWAEELEGLNDEEVWNFFDGLLYGYHGDVELADHRSQAECEADWEKWGEFNFLTGLGESLHGVKAFLMYPPGGGVRILARRPYPEGRLRVDVTREAVLSACEGFIEWFEVQERRLRTGAS